MSRKPSEATQLATLKREHRKLSEELRFVQLDRNEIRDKLLTAQREAAEWKERFDTLLKKLSVVQTYPVTIVPSKQG